MFSMIVSGKVQPKQRPKFNRFTGTAYTPEETATFESVVRYQAQQAMQGKAPFTGACSVSIIVYKSVPTSFSEKKRKACLLQAYPILTKPDLDNCAKSILDALNGVWFMDDKQVTELYVRKEYAEQDYFKIWCKEN